MRKMILMVMAVVLLIPSTAYAGGGGGGGGACPGFAEGTAISMLDSCFNGTAHFAPSGATVTVSNDGELTHTFTAVDGSFDSGLLQPGETFQATFDDAGVVRFFCTLHGTAEGQGMAGVLVIGEPTPESYTALANLDVLKAAVGEENAAIAEAMDRQTRAIAKLGNEQSAMATRLDKQPPPTPETAPIATPVVLYPEVAAITAPTILPVSVEADPGGDWIPTTTGLAIGLALASLLVVTIGKSRKRPDSSL